MSVFDCDAQAHCPPKKRSRVKAPGAGTPSCCTSETCLTSAQVIREPVVAYPPEGCDDNFDMLEACPKDSVTGSNQTINVTLTLHGKRIARHQHSRIFSGVNGSEAEVQSYRNQRKLRLKLHGRPLCCTRISQQAVDIKC